MHSPITAEATKFYDERYAGNYMDTDAYGVWGHGNLRTWQVLEALPAPRSYHGRYRS
jgi:hypothetical protein